MTIIAVAEPRCSRKTTLAYSLVLDIFVGIDTLA